MPIILSIIPNLETNPWDDVDRDEAKLARIDAVGVLPRGTRQGSPVVVVRAEVDGKPVFLQTSYRNMFVAMKAFVAVYGEPNIDNMTAIADLGQPS